MSSLSFLKMAWKDRVSYRYPEKVINNLWITYKKIGFFPPAKRAIFRNQACAGISICLPRFYLPVYRLFFSTVLLYCGMKKYFATQTYFLEPHIILKPHQLHQFLGAFWFSFFPPSLSFHLSLLVHTLWLSASTSICPLSARSVLYIGKTGLDKI